MIKRFFTTLLLFAMASQLFAPPNCEIYKNDKICYRGCIQIMAAIRNPQGSYESQNLFDKSIQTCPTIAYAHMEKGVAFLKRGDFITWKKLIDKAVELEPKEYLGYRGWCRLQFLRDYEGAIQDIEQLQKIYPYDIGHCQTGDYHLTIARALCYKELGQKEKALDIMEQQLANKKHHLGLYDYYHLGVLQWELGQYENALLSFQKQVKENDYLGETYYYIALIHKDLGQTAAYLENLEKAKSYYEKGHFRTDAYAEMIDKIYLADIEKELAKTK